MKLNTTKIVATAATVGLAGLFTQGVQAASVTNIVTITAKAWVQNDNPVDNGTNRVTPPPIIKSVTTKTVLNQLALDKFASGAWVSPTFPAGAKLVVFKDSADPVFQVLGKSNNFLVDVSDILSLNTGNRSVFSGKESDATGLANPSTTDRGLATLSFDDTRIAGGGNISFFLSGIFVSVTTDTKPNSLTGLYKEIQTHKASTAIGDGTYQGSDMVISGSINASGKATLQVVP